MRADRRITLRKPVAYEQNSLGDRIATFEDLACWANRRDLQGDEGIAAGAERYVARVRWMIPRTPLVDGLSPAWDLVGDDGHLYDINSVEEGRGARRRWWLVTSRRAGGVT